MSRRCSPEKTGEVNLMKSCEVVPEDLEMALEGLKEFAKPYLALMPRPEMREHGADFLEGLLTDLERKSTEPIAEHLGQARRSLQYFVGASPWDHEPLLDQLCEAVGLELGEENGILVVDPSSIPKKGKESVGVARQWCGRLGKQDNCQVGVFLGYLSNKGHTLVDERLYLPKEWAKDKVRRKKCGVPEGVRFRTSQQLALEMLAARGRVLPHRWVVADAEFGRPYRFRKGLEKMGERYVLEIPSNLLVRDMAAPPPRQQKGRGRRRKVPCQRVDSWAEGLKASDWEKVHIRDGTKGPLEVLAARTRVRSYDNRKRSKKEQWLMVIKTLEATPEYRYYFSNAEEKVALQEMVHVANARFWVEDCFERSKGKVGLDHYEVRSW
jgi:SRSO17 transposase